MATHAPSSDAPGAAHGPRADRIRGLDGLRAIAVTLVFLQHNTILRVLDLGGFGVSIFFVLSGFLIIGILHAARLRIESGASAFGPELAAFFKRRTLRIFPIYYLVLALGVPLAMSRHVIDAAGAAMLATYTANIWMGHVLGRWPDAFAHLWSLSIEEQFYLFAAMLFLLVPARRHFALCLGLVFAALATQLVLTLRHAPALLIYTDSIVNFGPIAFGGAAFLSLRTPPLQGTRSAWGSALLALCLVAPVLALVLGRVAAQAAVVSTGLLLACVFRNQASALTGLLELTPLRWFGRVSYGFYLFHDFLLARQLAAAAREAGLRVADTAPALLPISFALSLAAATASWVLIERPIQRLGRRASPAPAAAKASAVAADLEAPYRA